MLPKPEDEVLEQIEQLDPKRIEELEQGLA